MKVFQVIAEQNELDEIGLNPFGKLARQQRAANKAGKQSIKDEVNQLRIEFNAFLKTSKQPATAGTLLNYLKQKGYGAEAAAIIKALPSKGSKMRAKAAAQDKKAAAQAAAQKTAAGQAAAAAGLGNQGSAASINKMPADQQKIARLAASQYDEAAAGDVLSGGQIKSVIDQVVRKGFTSKAGYSKGKFAGDEPPATFKSAQGAPGDATQKAIALLKKAGYTVTKD
jgi:hypothetical protein